MSTLYSGAVKTSMKRCGRNKKEGNKMDRRLLVNAGNAQFQPFCSLAPAALVAVFFDAKLDLARRYLRAPVLLARSPKLTRPWCQSRATQSIDPSTPNPAWLIGLSKCERHATYSSARS